MKKFFTLIAATLLSIAANADKVKWNVADFQDWNPQGSNTLTASDGTSVWTVKTNSSSGDIIRENTTGVTYDGVTYTKTTTWNSVQDGSKRYMTIKGLSGAGKLTIICGGKDSNSAGKGNSSSDLYINEDSYSGNPIAYITTGDWKAVSTSAIELDANKTYYLFGSFRAIAGIVWESVTSAPVSGTAITPSSLTVAEGGSKSLTASANGYPLPTFQWYSCNADSTNIVAIDGATESTYTPSTTSAGTYYYICTATNTVSGTTTTVPSSIATVNVVGSIKINGNSYTASESDLITDGVKLVGDNVTMALADGGDFKISEANTEVSPNGQKYMISAGINPNTTAGTGAIYTITPTIAGTLNFSGSFFTGKTINVLKNGTGTTFTANGTEMKSGSSFAESYNGAISLSVAANDVVKIYADGSKVGCYGFSLAPDTLWNTTAVVSQFQNGGLAEAQRTLLFLSDSTFVVKEAFGEGTNDIIMTVNKQYDAVDFVGGKAAGYYKFIPTGGADIDTLCIYAAGYSSYCYALDSNSEYAYPNKNGGEIICSTVYGYKGQTYVNQNTFYVCWGKKRIYGTKDWAGVATLVGTPATEGTVDGNWKKSDAASIGFYYDEVKGDTVYRINNWYGADKYFHFRTTDAGTLSYVSNYIYTGDATVNYVYAYDGSYSYTYGDQAYNVKDLTKVHNGEIGFFAYAYDSNGTNVNYYNADWSKNYYIFDWENTDVPDPTAVNAVSEAKTKANTGIIKTPKYIIKNGVKYNYAGQQVK